MDEEICLQTQLYLSEKKKKIAFPGVISNGWDGFREGIVTLKEL